MSNKRNLAGLTAAIVLAVAALGGHVSAQQGGMPGMQMPGMGEPGMGGPGMGGPGMAGMMGAMMMHGPMHQSMTWGQPMMIGCFMMTGENGAFQSLDQRFAFMAAQIAITEAQRPQWEAWTASVKRSTDSMQAAWQTMWANMANMNFAERFSKQMEAMNRHLSTMQDILPSLSAVYGVLTPEQRGKADMMFAMMGCHW